MTKDKETICGTTKNSTKMLEEFAKRQELKKNENWNFDIKENLDAFCKSNLKSRRTLQ